MKKVFSKFEDVASVWAARSQQEGKSGNGSFFFHEDVAYSYRWSFPVAAMFDAPDGRKFCLVERESPSTSTSAVRSLAEIAARSEGCLVIGLSPIAPIVEMLARPKRKIGVKALNAIRVLIEADVSRIAAVAEKSPDSTWAQHSRLATVALLLRAHGDLAEAFGLDWKSPASLEAYEARAEMALEVSRKAAEDKRDEIGKAHKAAERRRAWEKSHPIPAAQELALWRTGERRTLQHQPEADADMATYARIVNGRFSTNRGWDLPLKDFSALFKASTAAAADLENAPERLKVGGSDITVHANGDLSFGWHSSLGFDELMMCAEIGAPKLHARALAMIRAAAAEEDAPAGPAP